MSELIDFVVSKVPTFETKIPSSNKKVSFRPFLVKEEKVLLMAQEMNSPTEKLNTIANLIENCFSGVENSKNLPLFDIEYLFLMLRAKSVGEGIHSILICPETGEKIDIVVNIDDIKIKKTKGHKSSIKLTDELLVEMKYPTLNILQKFNKDELEFNDNESTYKIISECISKIETPTSTYKSDSMSIDEKLEFLNNLSRNQFDLILNFFFTSPKIEKEVNYQTSAGKDRKILLTGLLDFFV